MQRSSKRASSAQHPVWTASADASVSPCLALLTWAQLRTAAGAGSHPLHNLAPAGQGSPMLAARHALHAALQIRGLTKKGKEFYRFTTNLTEQLRTLHVCDSSVWVTGEFLVTEFQDSREAHFYTAPDRINDADVSGHSLAALHQQCQLWHAGAYSAASVRVQPPLWGAKGCSMSRNLAAQSVPPALQLVPLSMTGVGEPGWTSVLACQDRCVRFLHRSTVLHQVGLSCWTLPGPSLNANLLQPGCASSDQWKGRESHALPLPVCLVHGCARLAELHTLCGCGQLTCKA